MQEVAWVNSLSYAKDLVLLAPTVTALQTLFEVCRAYAGSNDIVYNTTKTVCMLVRPKQLHGQFSTTVCIYHDLGYIMTAKDTKKKDDKDTKKQFRRQNAVGNMLVRKFSFAPIEAKIQLFKSYSYPIMDVLFGVIHSRTLLESLLSVIVTHSSVLLTSPHTPARVWHLR